MKKFFSAILLMTMMVFSVGTFVSCNDLVNEIEGVKGQATELEAAVDALEAEIATLETALQNAKAEAADAAAKAKAAADEAQKTGDAAAKAAKDAAAAAAAAQASADALATQLADAKTALQNALDGKADKASVDAVVAEIEALKTALAGKADATNVEALKKQLEVIEATLKNYETLLNNLKLKDDELAEAISYNLEAITNLQGQLEAQSMKVEDLEAAVAKLVAEIKTVNEKLVVIYDILGALANQIQSVVFVPEYDTDVVYAQRYILGDPTISSLADCEFSNYIATATFEVRPAKLATSITSENVCFTSVDVTATKAASEPEYFAAKVLDTDANTGRIIVAAMINDKSSKEANNDYDMLAKGKIRLSLNIASIDVTELLIADSEPTNIDMISSEYVNVVANKDLPLSIGFANVAGKKVEKTYTNSISMPWDTPVEESEKALFTNPVSVLIDGKFLTIEEANKLLGTTISYTTKVETTYVGAIKDKVYPVKVNGNDLGATAILVTSADYPKENAVGKKAIANLTVAITDAAKTNIATLRGTSTYEIANKKADFTFSSVTEDWKYTYGSSMTVKGRELAVTGYDKFTKDQNLGKFTATWGKDGKATTTVTALSSKAVTFDDVVLPFTPGKETTYTFKGQVIDGTTTYSVAFDVVLGAMPEDKPIDLGTFTITGDVVAEKIVAVSPITKAIADIKAYDSSITLEAAYAKFVEEDCVVTGVKGDGVTLNGKPDASAASLSILTATNDKGVHEEKSFVKVNPVDNFKNTIVVTKTYKFCDVKYTFTATVITKEPQGIQMSANNVYVNNGITKVDGTVQLPVVKNATSITTGSSSPYVLNAIDLRKYVHVAMPTEINVDGYELRYRLLTPLTDAKNQALYPVNPSVVLQYEEVDLKMNGEGAMPLNWNVDLNELKYEIALVSTSRSEDRNGDKVTDYKDDIVFGTPIEVTLQIPALVTFAADNVVKTKYVNGVPTKANIVGALSVVDKFGNAVYNPYADDLDHFFSGYYATLDAKGNVTGAASNEDTFFNVYDFTYTDKNGTYVRPIAGDLADVKVYLNNTPIEQTQIKFSYDKTTGEIILSEDNADITGDIKFEVPVTLYYLYDNYGKLAQKATAVVVFSQNAEGSENTPEVVMPSPDGKQWVVASGTHPMLGIEAPIYFDFGTGTVNNYFGLNATNAFTWGYYQKEAFTQNDGEVEIELLKADTWYAHEVLSYTIKAKDQSSGTIEIYPLYPNNAGTALEPYTADGATVINYFDYDGTSVKISWGGKDDAYACKLAEKPVTEFAYFNPAGSY